MSIDNHVVVNISKDTVAPSQIGFGTPAVLSLEAALLASFAAIKVKTYDIATALTDLIADGFTTASQTYKSVAAQVSQSPRPQKIKVIKRAVSVVQVDTNTIDLAVNDTTYTTTINGIPFTYLSDANATLLEIQAGLVAAINLGTEPVTAAPSGADAYTLTSDNAGEGFSNAVDANQSIVLTTSNTGPVTELIAAQDEDDDFYFVVMDIYTNLDTLLMAAYIETQLKQFSYQTDDADSKDLAVGVDITSLMAVLASKNYDRTFGVWVPTAKLSEHKHSGWVGLQASKKPGSTNWAHKSVNGSSADNFTAQEYKNIHDKNGNTYTIVSGVDIFFDGKMSSGEYIDITRGIDWVIARVKENVFGLLTSSEKVPYNDGGIESIGLQVEQILNGSDGAESRLILVRGSSSVTVPLREETSVADRANRILRDVKFSGELVGAINKSIISGTLTI